MSQATPRVVYTGAFRFPTGDAAGARVLGIGKALRAGGSDVVFAGWEKPPQEPAITQVARQEYQEFPYYSQGELETEPTNLLKRLRRHWHIGDGTVRWMQNHLEPGVTVIAYGGTSRFLLNLDRLCRERRCSLVLDITEWYDPRQLAGGKKSLSYWDSEIRMRFVTPRFKKLIVISRYLEDHFRRDGASILRVPPLVDLQDPRWLDPTPAPSGLDPIRLVYAGSPGKKDIISTVCPVIETLRRNGIFVQMQLVGPVLKDLSEADQKAIMELNRHGDYVRFTGRVPQEEVPRILKQAHFSVLLRPQARYAQAGFPTKVVESLAAGVPVITNTTSDLHEVLHDGKEGFLLDEPSADKLVSVLTRVSGLKPEDYQQMRCNACRQAEALFDYRVYTDPLMAFLFD